MPLISSDGKLFLTFGFPEESPELVVTQANQLDLKKSDLRLEADRKVLFGGNGQISAVGDLSFLTGATSPTERLKIFANGNIGIGTGVTLPTNKLEVVGKIKANDLEVTGTITANTIAGPLAIQNNLTVSGNLKLGDLTVNKFSSDGNLNGNSDLSVPTEKAVKTYVDSKLTGGSSQWSDLTGGSISYSKGNVGIGTGTTSPQEQLVVMNKSVFGKNITSPGGEPITVAGGIAGVSFQDRGEKTNRFVIYNQAGALRFWEGDDKFVIAQNTGNVGIGTDTPSAKLHIYEPTDREGQGGSIKFFDKGTNWKYEVSYDGGTDGNFAFTNTGIASGETRFKSTAGNLLTIKNTGEVSGRLVNTSSRELKENITDVSTQEAIEALANLNPVKFNYREDNQKQLKAGFIAEDVPELLATADRKGICALDVVAVLTKVIQQQQEELSCLKERLNALEARA
jgi:Chaperone of endosialidase